MGGRVNLTNHEKPPKIHIFFLFFMIFGVLLTGGLASASGDLITFTDFTSGEHTTEFDFSDTDSSGAKDLLLFISNNMFAVNHPMTNEFTGFITSKSPDIKPPIESSEPIHARGKKKGESSPLDYSIDLLLVFGVVLVWLFSIHVLKEYVI